MRGNNIRQDINEFKENLKIILNLDTKVKWKDLMTRSNEIFEKLIKINEKLSNKLGITDLSPIQALDYLEKMDFFLSNNYSMNSKVTPRYLSFDEVKKNMTNEINSIYQNPNPRPRTGPPKAMNDVETKGEELFKIKQAVNTELREVLKKRRIKLDSSN